MLYFPNCYSTPYTSEMNQFTCDKPHLIEASEGVLGITTTGSDTPVIRL